MPETVIDPNAKLRENIRTIKWPQSEGVSSSSQHNIEVSLLFRSSEYSSAEQNDDQDTATLYFLVRGALDEVEAVGAVKHRNMASGKMPGIDDKHTDYTDAEETNEDVEPSGGVIETLNTEVSVTSGGSVSSGSSSAGAVSSGGAASGGSTGSSPTTSISAGATIKVFKVETNQEVTGTGIVPWKYNDALPRRDVKVEERIDDTTWVVAVRYASGSASRHDSTTNRDADQFTFEVSTMDKHMVRAIKTTKLVSSEDSNGFINDGKGVDIKMPCASFSETHEFSDSKFKRSVRNAILAMVGKINDKKFRGFAAKEVLFVGASGSRNGTKVSDKWHVTFNFAIQKTQTVPSMKVYTDEKTTKTLPSFKKPGWDYLWFRMQEVKNATITTTNMKGAVRTEIRIYGVFVSQVYETADFGGLKI